MPADFSEFAGADRPLTDPRADLYGRFTYAGRIARELGSKGRREHLVVALDGECGSGRTTLKNFIAHAIRDLGKGDTGAATVVDFNPWGVNAERMGEAFFESVTAQLVVQSADTPAPLLEAAWQAMARAMTGASTPAPMSEQLREAQRDLREAMTALENPVVVFVDDIDRLAAPHLEAFLHLLGSQLHYPNLVCFLLYQKTRVIDALTGASIGELLRKLIHVELQLPDVPDTVLRRQLEVGLEKRLGTVVFPARSRDRWSDQIGAALWPFFATPRDVHRFLAALAFPFDGFFNPEQQVLEVNPLDLVLLEALRMFAPAVYGDLRDTFRRPETRIVRLMSGREEERKEVRVELDGTVQRMAMSTRQKRAVIAALQHLVPLGTGGVQGGRDDWDRDLRFCSPRHVERYFHLGSIIDAMPAHRLIAIARSTSDRTQLETLLLQAAGENMLPEVLDRLPVLIQGLPETQGTIAAVALCSICDKIPASAPPETEGRLVKFACELFAAIKNPLRRENIVAALLDDPERLTGPVLLLQALRPRSDTAHGGASSTLTLEQFRRLVATALDKLKENALSGAIWQSREAGTLIRRWWDWAAEKDAVHGWLLHQVKDPINARRWLRTFVSPSLTSGNRELMLQLDELAQYCDANAIAAGINPQEGDAIDRAAAKLLAQALAHKGTSPGFAMRPLALTVEAAAA